MRRAAHLARTILLGTSRFCPALSGQSSFVNWESARVSPLAFSGSDLPLGDPNDFFEPLGPPSLDTHVAIGAQVTIGATNGSDPAVIGGLAAMEVLASSGAVGWSILRGSWIGLALTPMGWLAFLLHALGEEDDRERVRGDE